jgi:WD40 repeat protein
VIRKVLLIHDIEVEVFRSRRLAWSSCFPRQTPRRADCAVLRRNDGQEVTVLRGNERRGRSATFSSDGAGIVIAFADRAARIWDATTGMKITRIALDAAVLRVALS